ncbi:MAG: peptidoglycan DD-metalloendopeptidase family protein [Candidatus Krumholzibacteriia bacterium]
MTILHGLFSPPSRSSAPATADAARTGHELLARLDSLGRAAISPAAAVAADPAAAGLEQTVVIGRNETFQDAMHARGVSFNDIKTLIDTCRPYRNLHRVRTRETFRIVQRPDRSLERISFDLDEESYVELVRSGAGFEAQEKTHPVERRVVGVSGTINASLYESLRQATAPLILAVKMNDVLGWDVDFNRDLQRGDSFRILYEEVLRDGKFVRVGAVLALECVVGGKPHRAFRYETAAGEPGFYDAVGGNLVKQMLRVPVEYSRISSGFSLARRHPIFNKVMPHQGIDYAAPVGTPVHASASGTVTAASVQTGAGRYVTIRHESRGLESSYLHLSRFAAGMHAGVRVKQGDVIGYVGASGWATGPHLDYRVKQNGCYIDPRKLRLPAAPPIPDTQRQPFLSTVSLYAQALDDLPSRPAAPGIARVVIVRPPHAVPQPEVSVLMPRTPPVGS